MHSGLVSSYQDNINNQETTEQLDNDLITSHKERIFIDTIFRSWKFSVSSCHQCNVLFADSKYDFHLYV